MASEGNKTNAATKPNTLKRKIGKLRKWKNSTSLTRKRKSGLFHRVTELSILCKARTALIIISPDKKLYACGYPTVDAVIQQFLDGKKKEDKEIVETLEYEAIQGDEKNFPIITDEARKSSFDFPSWWNNSSDGMSLKSLEEFKTSMVNLRFNIDAVIEEKKKMFKSN